MKSFISRIRSIRPVKAIFTCLVGVLLLVSQACGSVSATTPYTDTSNSGTKTQNPYNNGAKSELKSTNPYKDGANSELRVPKGADINSPYEGGMNNYGDVDPRSKGAIDKAKAKAEYLTENAKRNISKDSESFADVKDNAPRNIKENAKDTADNVKSKFEDTRSDFSKGLKKGSRNLKDSLDNAGEYIQDQADQNINNAKRNLDNTGDAIKDVVK
jgi:gas vesicle protein